MNTPNPITDPATKAITAALKRASGQALRRARAYGTESYIASPQIKPPSVKPSKRSNSV